MRILDLWILAAVLGVGLAYREFLIRRFGLDMLTPDEKEKFLGGKPASSLSARKRKVIRKRILRTRDEGAREDSGPGNT